ncbi:hypothetical protein BDW67DRAFT_25419 [Aspergillus spinulosporus]
MNSEEAGWLTGGDQASSGYESGPEVGSLASLQLQRHSPSSSSLVVLSPHQLHFSLPSIPRVALLPGNIQLSHSVCLTSALFLLPELFKTPARAVFLQSTKTFCSRPCPTTADTSHCHTSRCFFCPNEFLQYFLFRGLYRFALIYFPILRSSCHSRFLLRVSVRPLSLLR